MNPVPAFGTASGRHPHLFYVKASSPPLRTLACALAWALSVVHFYRTGVQKALLNFYGDFLSQFPAAPVAQQMGKPLFYAGTEAARWLPSPRWGYGPGFNLITLPLFLCESLRDAYRVWLVVNWGLVAAVLWLLIPRPVTLVRATAIGFLVLNFYPLYEALIQRNIEICELLLVLLAMRSYGRRRDATAGGLLGLAASLKFLPGIFVPYFLLKRRFRAAAAASLVLAAFCLAAEPILGWRQSWVLIQLREGSYLDTPLNQSVSGLVLRTARALGHGKIGPWLCRPVLVLLLGAFGALLIQHRRSTGWKLEWGLLCIAMIMLLPHNQNYYLVFLLLPYSVLLAEKQGVRERLLLGLSFLLTGWPLPLSLADRLTGSDVATTLLAWSVPIAGTALLTGLLVAAYRRAAAWPTG